MLIYKAEADDNGQISWEDAIDYCAIPETSQKFYREYGHMDGERIDLGELIVWCREVI